MEPRREQPAEINEPDGALPLRDALALALVRNPKLASVSWESRITEARKLQAGVLPNPEVEMAAEEVAGNGSRRGTESAVYGIRLSQLVELGGKRSARVDLADSERRLAGWDRESQRLAVLTQTTLGFIDVLAAQEHLALAQELVRISEKTLTTVSSRVEAGKVAPLERAKAEVEAANNRVAQNKADSELRASRKRLVATWGSTLPRFATAAGDLQLITDIPTYERVQALLGQNPEVARWAQEMERRLAALALEQARRIPDLTIGVSAQRFKADDEQAYAFSLGMPLPIFDRNQGGVLEARYRLAQGEHDRKDAEVRAAAALAESYEALVTARAEAIGLRDTVVPAATRAFEAAQNGYQEGKFSYLDVLDAQRTLFEARGSLLEAQARYQRSVAIIESLIGTSLDTLNTQPTTKD